MKEEERRKAALAWQKSETTQYNLRFMNASGVPSAICKAAEENRETTAEYLKKAIVLRLKADGFLRGEVVLNLNKKRHAEKVARLKKYVAQEEEKLKE